jgi:tetratricopeptide (TPR) repeat protein
MSNSTSTTLEPDYTPGLPANNPSTPGIGWSIAFLVFAIVIIRLIGSRQRSNIATEHTLQLGKVDQLPFTQSLQWVSFGKELEKKRQFNDAIAVYDQGLTHYPNNFRLWHERGLAFAKLQGFESALESFDRAYALRPNNHDLAHERGDTLLQLERYDEAIASFDIYLQYYPRSAHVLADRGYALYCLERYEEALKSLNQALKAVRIDRDQYAATQAYFFQTETLRQLGRLDEALRSAQAATQRYASPQNFDFTKQLESIQQEMAEVVR